LTSAILPNEKKGHTTMFLRRSLAAVVAAGSALIIGATVAGASMATRATDPAPGRCAPPAPIDMTFVPPTVGPIGVAIGPTIIDGKVIDPGMNVTLPGATVEPCPAAPADGCSPCPGRSGATGRSDVGGGGRRRAGW
jgi:hypothetical protein